MSARVPWRWLRRRNFLDGYCGEVLPGGEFRWFNSLSWIHRCIVSLVEIGANSAPDRTAHIPVSGSDSIRRYRIWSSCSASLQVLMDRNRLWNIHGFLQMIQGFISLIVLRFSNRTPYFRATLSAASPLDWFWIQSQLRWTYRSSKMAYLLRLTGYWSKMASFVRIGVDWFGDLSRKSSPTYWCSDSSQPFYPIQLTFCLRQSPHHDQHFSLS